MPKRPRHITFGARIPEETLRSWSRRELEFRQNDYENLLEGYEAAAKVARQGPTRIAYLSDAEDAKENLRQIQAEMKRRESERKSRIPDD